MSTPETEPPSSGRKWNTNQLGLRLGSDMASAASASALVAPLITIIDRGIIENASGRNTLGNSIKSSLKQLVLRPHRFIFSKPFGLIFMLYFGTYVTANTLDTASSTLTNKPAITTTAGPAKFIATSSTNLTLCLYKDSRFARFFGPPNALPRPVPPVTFALFALRDCLTIFASFNLPPLIATLLPSNETLEKTMSKVSIAQFVAPAGVQLVSTPLHLLGLDLYNRGGRDVSWRDRYVKVKENWLKSSLARMCRIVPAFGVGGVVNMRVRRSLMERLDG